MQICNVLVAVAVVAAKAPYYVGKDAWGESDICLFFWCRDVAVF